MKSRRVVSIMLAVAAALGVAASAFADANAKRPDYESRGGSSASFRLWQIRSTSDGGSYTGTEGTAGHAHASPWRVANRTFGRSVWCAAAGEPRSGKNLDEHAAAWQSVRFRSFVVSLFATWCRADAVQENNASGEAGASIVRVTGRGVEGNVVTSGSESKTTSGQSWGMGYAALADADVKGTELSVAECSTTSQANNGGTQTSSSASLLTAEGESIPMPACPFPSYSSDADASYTRVGPEHD